MIYIHYMEVENHLNWTEGLINAIDYIETHLIDGEVLDQNTIARQAYSSPDNFRKVFHLITGYTIGEYIRNPPAFPGWRRTHFIQPHGD